MFEDFNFEDFKEEFEKNSVNALTLAYKEIFDAAKEICEDGSACAEHGMSKQVAADVEKLIGIAAKLVEIERFSTPIIGPTGRVYNLFGEEQAALEEENKEIEQNLTEDDAIEIIHKIVNSVHKITMKDLKEEENQEENNTELGSDLDKYFK